MRLTLTALSCLAASSSFASIAFAVEPPAEPDAAAFPGSPPEPAANPPASSEPETATPQAIEAEPTEAQSDVELGPTSAAEEPVEPMPREAPVLAEPAMVELEPASELELEWRPRASRRGLYLRFAAGFGGYTEFMRSDDSPRYDGRILGQTVGIASLSELALGGSLAPGFVLGGGIYGAELLASTFRVDDQSSSLPPTELDPALRSLLLIGPFIDWYFNRGNSDLHWQAALGFAGLVRSPDFGTERQMRNAYVAYGLGLMIGAGKEWHLSGDWSLGLLGRVMLAAAGGKDDADVSWGHFASTSLGLLASVTYY